MALVFNMFRGALAAAVAIAVLPSTSALACNPTVTMAQVDQALASTKLKGSKLADANALRDDLAEALQRNDQHRAHVVEASVMRLMGYVEAPATSRGGCERIWKRAN